MVLAWKPRLNSFFARAQTTENSLIALDREYKNRSYFPNCFKKLQITKDICPQRGFCDKMSITPECSDSGENATEWARVSNLEVG